MREMFGESPFGKNWLRKKIDFRFLEEKSLQDFFHRPVSGIFEDPKSETALPRCLLTMTFHFFARNNTEAVSASTHSVEG